MMTEEASGGLARRLVTGLGAGRPAEGAPPAAPVLRYLIPSSAPISRA
jgi:hypothetical protein